MISQSPLGVALGLIGPKIASSRAVSICSRIEQSQILPASRHHGRSHPASLHLLQEGGFCSEIVVDGLCTSIRSA